MTLLENLMETGLTRHEAQLYLLLSSEGVMTGYEAAKQSGISRSNTYIALAGLAGKGGAMRIDGDIQRFTAVPAEEFCQNKRHHFNQVLQEIQNEMPMTRAVAEPFLTIRGRMHILDKMRNLISSAKQRVYLALAPDELQQVIPELIRLRDLGRKIVVITSPVPDLPGVTLYQAAKRPGQIRLIVDSSIVLTGEINEQGESSCLYSSHQDLVNLFKESMMNEIQLIRSSAGQAASDQSTGSAEGRSTHE